MTIVVQEALKRASRQVEADYLGFYVEACVATGSTPIPIRRIFRHQNLSRLFRTVIDHVQGDVVECGCARGLSSLMLCLTFAKRNPGWSGEGFHIFDSFQGLSEPSEKDLEFDQADANAELVAKNMVAGHFACSLQDVSANVHRLFPQVQLHPGWIPASFSEQPERTYRFVHIDVDLYQPTLDSLNYFFPRLAEGGMIITDDYNWPGARKAFKEFCSARGIDLQTTETSQAFLVKRRTVCDGQPKPHTFYRKSPRN